MKDCAIIIKNSVDPETGKSGIELQLVFTRKESDKSAPSEAEEFGQFAFKAVCNLYETVTNPPDKPQPKLTGVGSELGHNRFGAPVPQAQFTPPTILPGDERDLKSTGKS